MQGQKKLSDFLTTEKMNMNEAKCTLGGAPNEKKYRQIFAVAVRLAYP
jgi:hypothetical protein